MSVGKKGTFASKSQCPLTMILQQQKQEAPFDLTRPPFFLTTGRALFERRETRL